MLLTREINWFFPIDLKEKATMSLNAMAVLHIRTFGTCVLTYGAFNIILFIFFDPWALEDVAYSLRAFLCIILGGLLIVQSRRLAKILTSGLDDS
jgi:hypothetical protein